MKSCKAGVESWATFLLAHFGRPKWIPQEVKEYGRRPEEELDRGWHVYWSRRKVWSQKPYDTIRWMDRYGGRIERPRLQGRMRRGEKDKGRTYLEGWFVGVCSIHDIICGMNILVLFQSVSLSPSSVF